MATTDGGGLTAPAARDTPAPGPAGGAPRDGSPSRRGVTPPLLDTTGALRAAGCVFAEEEAALLVEAARDADDLARLTARRVAGEPLEQVLGWAGFAGLRVLVEPGVFVPRRRSELLVREALRVLDAGSRDPAARPLVVDLCCGTGALGAAVAAAADVELHAADVEPAAVRCARRNLSALPGSPGPPALHDPHGSPAPHGPHDPPAPQDSHEPDEPDQPDGARHHVHEGDLWEALPAALRGRVDVVVANAPYVPTDAITLMPPEARLHEPAVALDGGPDGTDVQARVAAGAATWLRPGGHVLVETGRRQAARTAALLAAGGLVVDVVTDDDLDGTVAIGRRPA